MDLCRARVRRTTRMAAAAAAAGRHIVLLRSAAVTMELVFFARVVSGGVYVNEYPFCRFFEKFVLFTLYTVGMTYLRYKSERFGFQHYVTLCYD